MKPAICKQAIVGKGAPCLALWLVLLFGGTPGQAVERHLTPDAWKPSAPARTFSQMSDGELEDCAARLADNIATYESCSPELADQYRAKLNKIRAIQEQRARAATQGTGGGYSAPRVLRTVSPAPAPSFDFRQRLKEQQEQREKEAMENRVKQLERQQQEQQQRQQMQRLRYGW